MQKGSWSIPRVLFFTVAILPLPDCPPDVHSQNALVRIVTFRLSGKFSTLLASSALFSDVTYIEGHSRSLFRHNGLATCAPLYLYITFMFLMIVLVVGYDHLRASSITYCTFSELIYPHHSCTSNSHNLLLTSDVEIQVMYGVTTSWKPLVRVH